RGFFFAFLRHFRAIASGIAVAVVIGVRPRQQPGQALRRSAGAHTSPNTACLRLQGVSSDLPVLPYSRLTRQLHNDQLPTAHHAARIAAPNCWAQQPTLLEKL